MIAKVMRYVKEVDGTRFVEVVEFVERKSPGIEDREKEGSRQVGGVGC